MSRLTNYWTMKAHEVATLPEVTAVYIETDSIPVVVKAKLPGDYLSLRGIPVMARGVSGAMRGTRPDVVHLDVVRFAA